MYVRISYSLDKLSLEPNIGCVTNQERYWRMARPRNTEERRRQIVDGLRLVMAENGYDGASVQAVAKAAGLTAGLVHYHF